MDTPDKEKVIAAIREFRFYNYGLDDVDPDGEDAEWVPDLADAVVAALGRNEEAR